MKLSRSKSNIYDNSLGMAWYKFLINFSLFAGAVINLIYGINYISGGIYEVVSSEEVISAQVYAYYGKGLRVIDVLYGFSLSALAIFAFLLRQKLANFKSSAPRLLIIFNALSAFVPFLYSIMYASITKQSIEPSVFSSLIGSLIVLFVNIVYFNKRAHLFSDKSTPLTKLVHNSSSPIKEITYDSTVDCEANPTIKLKKILYCSKCGTKLADNSTFCHNCGSKIL